MQLHADLRQRAVMYAEDAVWVPSPLPGVTRRMLDRDGGEVARATSVVRYAPGSRFSRHEHGGGEEFLVLEGTFSDEMGDYPAGTYVRNPPGSGHAPWSVEGCMILGKLRQFDPRDTARVVIDSRTAAWMPMPVPGVTLLPLHEFGSEQVGLLRWQRGTRYPLHEHPGGEEIYVIEGTLQDEEGRYAAGTWLRNPPGSRHATYSAEGCLLYVKSGHLG
jgi:anti-sigma factor ChrR (cupin superfamily)